jgi:tRNA nucleotidyltransferase (CCA-adding enzyme)
MARRGHLYPQVRIGAGDLADASLGTLTAGATAADAHRRAVRLGLTGFALASGEAKVVLRDDLRRAVALGLGAWPAARLARPVPVVGERASEIAVRRELANGAPLVLVDGEGVGARAVAPSGSNGAGAMGPPLARRLAAVLDRPAQQLLRRVAHLAQSQGGRAFAVGGAVRAAVRAAVETAPRDLDVVVEGDGLAVARLLAAETGGRLVEYGRFLTATVVDGAGRRIDVATTRAETYEAPGALPRVRPADIWEDLRRRDFTVNAMAAELSSPALCLVDPLGGRRDLDRRCLRVLHPLSFVEDPTRLFRAARYAARLGLRADPWTAECRRHALDLAPFEALSAARLVAELALLLAEARPQRALASLGEDGVFRLLDADYRYTAATAAAIARLRPALAWVRAHVPRVEPLDLLLLALLGDQTPRVAEAALRRLGRRADAATPLLAIAAGTPRALARLRAAAPRSAVARDLRVRDGLELAWLWLQGDRPVRLAVARFLDRDAAVGPWLSGDEVIALGVPRGPAVGRVLDELRDGRLDRTLAGRAAARRHVRRRIRKPMARRTGGMTGPEGG